MDAARFRADLEACLSRVEDLFRDTASASDTPERLVLRALEELDTCVKRMLGFDSELERLDRELVAAYVQATSERRRYRRFFLTADEAYVFTDVRGVIGEANRAAGELLGVVPQDLSGKPLAHLVSPSDRSGFRGWLRSVRSWSESEISRHAEFRLRTISRDHHFRCRLSVQPTGDPDGEHESLRWGLRDLTEHERALERDLLAEEAHRKDDFLAALAHELRNPLGAIALAADWLRELPTTEDVASVRRRAAILSRHVQHLSRLVNDLLDGARIRHGKIELERRPVELSEVVSWAAATVQPGFHDKQQRLEVRRATGPLWVEGDPDRLQQVVTNLLDNASKYSGVGGHIQVTLDESDHVAILSVRDDGIGIAPAMLESVFGLFEQIERPHERKKAGLGLGLALVRELVQLHGGHVKALSEGPGRGSEFVVTLPRHRS